MISPNDDGTDNPEDKQGNSKAQVAARQELVGHAQHGRLLPIELAIEQKKVSVNMRDKDNCTLLHWAAANNRVYIASYLLDKGVGVNLPGGVLNETPLQWCVRSKRYGYTQMVQLLLRAGADVNHRGTSGNDALHVCVQNGSVNIVFMLLAMTNCNVNTVNNAGDTPLLWLLKNFEEDLGSEGRNRNVVRLLLNSGANVHAVDSNGNTALHLMALLSPYEFDLSISLMFMEKTRKYESAAATQQDKKTSILLIKNNNNDTPSMIASTRSSRLTDFLGDYKHYSTLPVWTVTVHWALTVYSLFLLFHFYVFWGVLGWLPVFASALYFSQSSIRTSSSRSSCGAAWGLIISLYHGYAIYTRPHIIAHLSHWIDKFLSFSTLITFLTLYLTTTTSPATLSRAEAGDDSVRILAEKIALHGIPDGVDDVLPPVNTRIGGVELKGDGDGDGDEDGESLEQQKRGSSINNEGGVAEASDNFPPQLCSTCFIDRSSASVHCSECDCCRVALDHHCPFVNNCVGRGNRRVFVMFCGSAGFTALGSWGAALFAQYTGHRCEGRGIYHFGWRDVVDWQGCMILETPAFPLITFVSFLVAGWILSLFFYQLHSVATETTTFQSISTTKRNNDPRKNNQAIVTGEYKGVRTSVKNIYTFFKTGQFLISHRYVTRDKGEGEEERDRQGWHGHEHDDSKKDDKLQAAGNESRSGNGGSSNGSNKL